MSFGDTNYSSIPVGQRLGTQTDSPMATSVCTESLTPGRAADMNLSSGPCHSTQQSLQGTHCPPGSAQQKSHWPLFQPLHKWREASLKMQMQPSIRSLGF